MSFTAKTREFYSAIANKISSFSVFSQAISSLLFRCVVAVLQVLSHYYFTNQFLQCWFHDKTSFTVCKCTDAKQIS
jgi:hypothetical protein